MHIPEYVWRSEDTLWELVLSFYHICPRDLIRLSNLVTGAFYPQGREELLHEVFDCCLNVPYTFFKKKFRALSKL